MNKIKILILLLISILNVPKAYNQDYKFKTTSVSVSLKTLNDKWGNWTTPKQTNIIITLNTKKSRIVVYSEVIQLFEIIQYLDEKITPKDNTVSFICKDNNGEECNVNIITRKNQNNRIQFYIIYEDRIINYNVIIYK